MTTRDVRGASAVTSRHSNLAQRPALTKIEVLVAVCLLCLGAWFLIPAMTRSQVAAKRAQCLVNLQGIGRAIGNYLEDSGNVWPCVAKLRSFDLHDPPWPTWPDVLTGYHAATERLFRCPADERTLDAGSPLAERFGTQTTWFETEGTSYEWTWAEAYGGKTVGEETLGSGSGAGRSRADQPLLTDFEPFHKGDDQGAFNTLFADLRARTARTGVMP